jgi:microcystin-dependent protein
LAQGHFTDEQSTLVLDEVIATAGAFPSTSSSNDDNIIGLIRTFAFDFAPGGYSAEGQILAIDSNAGAYEVFGTTFGGNITTFDLPDLSGYVAVGASSSAPLGTSTGASTASVSASQFPASLGGTAQPVTLAQPSLSVQYLIRTAGDFPSSNTAVTGGFIGEVMPYTGSTVPSSFVVANGQLLPISQYAALFSIIGTTYGGNGTSTFAVPNLTGRVIVGTSPSSPTLALGAVVGQSTVTLTNADLPTADGGTGASFADQSPGLALNYIICVQGNFPTRDATGDAMQAAPYLGEIKAFAGTGSSIPSGWLLCDGQTLSISSNEALFSLLGTTFGGDGRSTFALPNLEDRTVASLGTNDTLGQTYGANTATLAVTNNAPCLCRGTLVLTPRGEVAVETLRIGDEVTTASFAVRKLLWIGQRSYEGAALQNQSGIHPVRFRAGSLGGGIPRRDLLVSPDHAMLLDGVLIPARCLVNGATILVETDLAAVDYFHLELATHDVLLAEGAACESFVDDDSRQFFDNAAEFAQLYPDAVSCRDTCVPKIESGPLLAAIRRRLDGAAVQEVWLSRVGVHSVNIAPGVSAVRLLTPSAYISGDARKLGAAIDRVALDGEPIALNDRRLSAGWHAPEAAWRWTDGAALVEVCGAVCLELSLAAWPVAKAA